MIHRERLLTDLQKLLRTLEGDLRERCESEPEVDAPARREYDRARAAGRTGHAYEIWRDEYLTQVAAAWILACVFVRFLEDNGLVDAPRLAGPGPRLGIARDHHTAFIEEHPTETDREYLQSVFRDAARLPSLGPLLGESHNPLFAVGLTADGARELLAFWQRIDHATGELVHDFTDPTWNTRFLGDLYQDLSASARKTYALRQTPEFIEEFILDRTLEPAIREFGYQAVRLIDLACGSGHFLLGTFARLFTRWSRDEPATNPTELAQRTLDAVHGVDLNPFAVAIARFRLLVVALHASALQRLADAPGFRVNLAVGDSLLHGPRSATAGLRVTQRDFFHEPLAHVYDTEDAGELRRLLGQRYHVVVGNPPYITVKDAALNHEYRNRFGACHRQYSLAVPFMERFFDVAIAPEPNGVAPAGFVGMITANSFMKREFGKKLIAEFIPQWDLTHVIDTSGIPVPEHGTSTVILLARSRHPVEKTIRAVLGIRSDPPDIADPAHGGVWRAILAQTDESGSRSHFISVSDILRERFHSHPWSIGGGGAADLKDLLDETGRQVLGDLVESIGFYQDTHADEVFVQPLDFVRRHSLQPGFRPQVRGDEVRDWFLRSDEQIFFPHDAELNLWAAVPVTPNWAWLHSFRTVLWSRSTFGGGTYRQAGRPWFDFHQFPKERARTPRSIAFAFVATHNHFVVDRGGKVFNRSAPVIKLIAAKII